jgi:SAM-dependent methyltransferase
LAWLFFQRTPQLFHAGGLCVHVAPEPELGRQLRRRAEAAGMTYRSGNISASGDQYMDILDLPMEDQSVDLFYCCHVLNSMNEDRQAMREVHRVLRPTGTAVLQVPAFYEGATTLEAGPEEADRLRLFKDVGISRCYTDADYVHRLQEAGFQVRHYRAKDLPEREVEKYALKAEVFHVCTLAPEALSDGNPSVD